LSPEIRKYISSHFIERRDYIGYRDLIFRLIIHCLFFWVIFFLIESQQLALALAVFFVNATLWQFWGFAGIAHELFHGTVFANKKINSLFFYVASYLTWSNPKYYINSHLFHHRKTFDSRDREIPMLNSIGIKEQINWIFLDLRNCRRIFYVIFNSCGYEVFFQGRSGLSLTFAKIKDLSIIFHAWAILCVNCMILFLIWFVSDSYFMVLVSGLTPFCCTWLFNSLAFWQHSGLYKHRSDGALWYARTIKLPRWIEFFYANMNYHAEHHLVAGVPYYNLPLVEKYIADTGVARVAVVRLSLIQLLKSCFSSESSRRFLREA